ncbi:MAG: hypothetical protein AAF430_25140 [Myxococcota bacterium]
MRPTLSLTWLATTLAASLASADLLPFDGTIAIGERSQTIFAGFGDPVISVVGSGTGESSRTPVNEINGFTGVTGFTGSTSATTPSFAAVRLELFGIGAANFAESMMVLGGPMAVPGRLRTFLSPGGATFRDNPLTIAGTRGLGLGGSIPFTPLPTVTPIFDAWRTGVVQLSNVSTENGAVGNITAQGFDSRTANGAGAVQLVSATRIARGSLGIPDGYFITRLTLVFVPEPTRAALFACGALATGLLASLRSRHR